MIPLLVASLAGLSLPGPTPTVETPLMTADAQWALVAATVRVAAGAGRPPFGTAVCVGARGGASFLLTASHVVPAGEARSYELFARASYPAPSEVLFEGDVVLRLPECDLALVKVTPAGDLPAVPLARLDQRPRRFPVAALALGCPDGDAPAVRREVLTGRRLMKRPEGNGVFWETAGSPRGGMSGGPLVDGAGRLLGVCAASRDGQGYSTHADEILAGLKRHGYGWLADGPRKPAADSPTP